MTGSKKIKKREYKGFLFLLPSFAGVCLFWVIPYLDVIRRSFFSAVSGEFTGLKNYSTIFENQAFRLAAGNTLRFFLVCIPLLVVLSLMIAVLLTRRKKSMQALKSMFLLPMAIPVASVVLLWKVLFHDQGLLNHFLETFPSGRGLDEYGRFLLGAGSKLSVEKSGIRYCSVGGRAWSHSNCSL